MRMMKIYMKVKPHGCNDISIFKKLKKLINANYSMNYNTNQAQLSKL
jgi:hypothetical protein